MADQQASAPAATMHQQPHHQPIDPLMHGGTIT